MFRVKSIILIVALPLLFDNCATDMKTCTQQVPASALAAVDQARLAQDIIAIDNYLANAGIVATKDPSGIRYLITVPGDGKSPCLESDITVIYTGKLMSNGNVFDSTVEPVVFTLNNLILGWKLGFLKLNPGATATLYIPSGYGYGKTPQTKIPANSNLIFDVRLIDIAF